MTHRFRQSILEVDELITTNRLQTAQSALERLIQTTNQEELLLNKNEIISRIDRFYKNRRRDLLAGLTEKLSTLAELPKQNLNAVQAQVSHTKSNRRAERDGAEASPQLRILSNRLEQQLSSLLEKYIFKWDPYYKEVIGDIFADAIESSYTPQGEVHLGVVREAIEKHTTALFQKGFDYATARTGQNCRQAQRKSINGLGRFLALPTEVFRENRRGIIKLEHAKKLRNVTSSIIEAILCGYARINQESLIGSQLMYDNLGSWARFLTLIESDSLWRFIQVIDNPDLRASLEDNLLPVVKAVDHIIEQSNAEYEYCFPQLGEYIGRAGRLEYPISLPRNITVRNHILIHCYLDPGSIHRSHLEEANNGNIDILTAPLDAQIRIWVTEHEKLRNIWVDTAQKLELHAQSGVINKIIDRINSIIADLSHMGGPIIYNVVKDFPSQEPFRLRHYRVKRRSIRGLLNKFEQETGVHLWCSVRRSGKTTSCFDLSTEGTSKFIMQTMQPTGQYPQDGVFHNIVMQALDDGRQIDNNFFTETVRRCFREMGKSLQDHKIVFLIDEYESLFECLAACVEKSPILRYKFAQPFMNGMVEFSRDNLLIFVGQRPDAHSILMDQNQLSPYVKQDAFPLFEHDTRDLQSEFSALIQKAFIGGGATFSADFADAVFGETKGHPLLTIEVLIDFYEWMIENQRLASDLNLQQSDFLRFSSERLTRQVMHVTRDRYTIFRPILTGALSEKTRKLNPWVYIVNHAMRQISLENPNTFSCSVEQFCQIVRRLGAEDPYGLLTGACMSNFFTRSEQTVMVAIPIMARIAMATEIRG